MLSGGIDSPVAGYMAMKRGIKIEAVYFESPPHTSEGAKNKVKELVEKLNVEVIPLYVNFSDEAFLDGIELTTEKLYEKVEEKKKTC